MTGQQEVAAHFFEPCYGQYLTEEAEQSVRIHDLITLDNHTVELGESMEERGQRHGIQFSLPLLSRF